MYKWGGPPLGEMAVLQIEEKCEACAHRLADIRTAAQLLLATSKVQGNLVSSKAFVWNINQTGG